MSIRPNASTPSAIAARAAASSVRSAWTPIARRPSASISAVAAPSGSSAERTPEGGSMSTTGTSRPPHARRPPPPGGARTVRGMIEFEARGKVALITINRPEARNAVNGAVATGLQDAVERLEADPALWAGVIAGAGPAFSAGADLKEIAAGRHETLAT